MKLNRKRDPSTHLRNWRTAMLRFIPLVAKAKHAQLGEAP